MYFHRLQALHDLNAARAALRDGGASEKTCAPLDHIAVSLRDLTSPSCDIDWTNLTKPLGAEPAGVLAALAQGLCRLKDHHLTPDHQTIPKHAHLSRSKQQVDDGLTQIARGQLSEEVCKVVAMADYGNQARDHEAALLHMRDMDFANIPLKERWVPMEVIELVSHVPKDFGHVPCLALVMLDAVRNHDAYGAASFRWERQHAHILGLTPTLKDPLCAAFRYLYETGDAEDLFFEQARQFQKAGEDGPDGIFFPFQLD